MLFALVQLFGPAADLGVEVVALAVPDVQEPAHVVDAGDGLAVAGELVGHAKMLQQAAGADLDAVAKAHGLHLGIAQHVARQHGHRVGVVQQPGVGADLLHVPGEFGHDGDGPQAAHDAADAKGVGDGLAQAVLFGDLEIDDGGRLIAADLDGVDHEPGPTQGLPAVFRAEIGADHRPALVDVPVQGLQNLLALPEPDRVDVVQGDLAAAQGRGTHDVAQNVPGKNGAAGTEEGDLEHGEAS